MTFPRFPGGRDSFQNGPSPMISETSLVAQLRQQFPALDRKVGDRRAIYFDGPAGTQVPRSVIHEVSQAMAHHNANLAGMFATSRECTQLMVDARLAFADFFGVPDADQIAFGANATTITFSVSRALARTWQPGDEVVVTDLGHDANITPWVLAAEDRGVTVRHVAFRKEDCTLDLNDLLGKINDKTRLVAVAGASNSVGTRNPVREICKAVHDVGGLVYVDGVHYAPHVLTDIPALDCDFFVCSAYKFFGPHVGILWGRDDLLERLDPYKVRPAPNSIPGKWMTGTQNHPCVAGSMAAVDYLAGIGRLRSADAVSRRDGLRQAFTWIADYESRLVQRLLEGLAANLAITVYGPPWGSEQPRLPTVSLRHRRGSAKQLATFLAEHGVFVWHGNYYALRLSELLGNEPDGMVRLGMVHYNEMDEVERTLELLERFQPA